MDQDRKKIVFLYNLGTPSSPNLRDIKKYLFQFLMDPCVIDVHFLWRLFLVGVIIVPFRAPQTRKSYREIWTKSGSPLLTISRSQVRKLNQKNGLPVHLVMRYGEPNLKSVLRKVVDELVAKTDENHSSSSSQLQKYQFIFVPLYPHAALSTTETVYREIAQQLPPLIKKLKSQSIDITTRTVLPFYHNQDYLSALARSILPHQKEIQQTGGHLLFSYHGIPERHLKKTDPGRNTPHCLTQENCCDDKVFPDHLAHQTCYRFQTKKTTEQVVKQLKIDPDHYSHSYQSRLGRDPWLTPYTDETVKLLAQKGVKKLWVICPAFVADNLETLFEIQIENQEIFQAHGGEKITLIPCLNDRDDFTALLDQLIRT